MEYKIINANAFIVLMQKVELTNLRKANLRISMQFWNTFNKHIKSANLSQSSNWLKYAFMQRQDGKLSYSCAIPYKDSIPDSFQYREIPAHTYMVVEHVGSMTKIYETYDKIYTDILPKSKYVLDQNEFLHFEKYDHRFHWNRIDSIIEIWIPILTSS